MRVWDLPLKHLCRQHLLGEHRELHALWTILREGRSGYARHPETLRWEGRLPALAKRHALQARELERRGYAHKSPLRGRPAGSTVQRTFVNTLAEQRALLRKKGCACRV